jgi:drug/metabolite transporter (DMT)-like permease
MNAAAPTVAVVTAIVPVAVGLAQGERPGVMALVGVAIAVVAVGLVGGASAPGPHEPRATARALMIAVGAGVGLGLANVAFAQTSVDAGLWPVAATKLVAGIVLWGYVVAAPRPSDTPRARRNVTTAVWTGLVDAGATVSLALALQRGSLVLVSVLGSMFPAVTVVLARFILRERIGRAQAVGLGLALAAVAMIVGG